MTNTDSIVIATDFSEAPGARYRTDGPKSGQEFLEELLEPRFIDAMKSERRLLIDFDGTWGYASSFISGAFGILSRKYGREKVTKYLTFKSDEDSLLLEKVRAEINRESAVA